MIDATAPDAAAAQFTIVGGNPTVEEVAAVTGVLNGVLEELANEHVRSSAAGESAWQRSQRGLRSPLAPGPGAWRNFAG